MTDHDFDTYDDSVHDKYDVSDGIDDAVSISRQKNRQAKCKRRRIEELLEEKQLRQELEEYDDGIGEQDNSHFHGKNDDPHE